MGESVMNKTALAQQNKTAGILPTTQHNFLQRRCNSRNRNRVSEECAYWASGSSGLQRKLALGAANDPLEREADRIADQVMVMSGSEVLNNGPLHRQPVTGASDGFTETVPKSVRGVLAGPGRPLEPGLRQDMEQRFGHDFSQVRVHSGPAAEQSAREINAHAYTVGNRIVFGSGLLASGTNFSRKIIAHELVHVMQQRRASKTIIRRRSGCSKATITKDHDRARKMVARAITKVSSYDGTTPKKVYDALNKHFHGATSKTFAAWINLNLRFLLLASRMAGYVCYTGGFFEKRWACGSQRTLASTFWCVPGVDIRLCPSYFRLKSPRDRSTTMIHEWVHKYGCNFDLGYNFEPKYRRNSTITQLINADSFASFVRDVL